MKTCGNVSHLFHATGLGPHIVDSCQHNNDLRIYAIEFTVAKSPKNIFDSVPSPPEIGGVPAEEVLLPILQKRPVLRIGSTPTAGDGITDKKKVKAALFGFSPHLFVGFQLIFFGAGYRLGLLFNS